VLTSRSASVEGLTLLRGEHWFVAHCLPHCEMRAQPQLGDLCFRRFLSLFEKAHGRVRLSLDLMGQKVREHYSVGRKSLQRHSIDSPGVR